MEYLRSLNVCREISLVGAGDFGSAAETAYPEYHVCPNVKDPSAAERLVDLCLGQRIDMFFPAHDDATVMALGWQTLTRRQVGSHLIPICTLLRSKSQTYDNLKDVIRVPDMYSEVAPGHTAFVKPDKGQGTRGIYRRISSQAEWLMLQAEHTDLILCEYLPGPEYTVDCFTESKKGQLQFVGVRARTRVSHGIATQTQVLDYETAWHPPTIEIGRQTTLMAHAIQESIPMAGAWFFQCRTAANGELALMEIAPRISGSSGVWRAMNVNLPLLAFHDHLGRDVSVLPSGVGTTLHRHLACRVAIPPYNQVYIDFDDCLHLGDKLNVKAVAFLAQCHNEGVRVVVLTRSEMCVCSWLHMRGLQGLVSDVVQVPAMGSKGKYLATTLKLEDKAIFIDDSFAERKDVQSRCKIPVFGPEALDLLIKD